jgi:hypothetical protein
MIISNGVGSGIWSGIEAFGAELIAVSDSGNINKYDTSTNSFIEFSTLPESARHPSNWELFNRNYCCQCLCLW